MSAPENAREDVERGQTPLMFAKIKGPGPFRLVAGVGCSRGCPADELLTLIDAVLAEAGGTLAALATVDRRASEPCVVAAARGLPLRTYGADELADVDVPTPSAVVARHVGTASVAEAAALLAGGRLVVAKRKSGTRRVRWRRGAGDPPDRARELPDPARSGSICRTCRRSRGRWPSG